MRLEDGLRNAEARYQRALQRADALRVERDHAIRAALAAGMTQRQVAATLGLSAGRVGQIATRKEQER